MRLKQHLVLLMGLSILALSACSSPDESSQASATIATPPAEPVLIEISTSMGTLVVALNLTAAPLTVSNFLSYVDAGFYNDLIFHRVIANFMIQGGGFNQSFQRAATLDPIRNESDNGLSNQRGTIAMARTQDPHSATSQFFINLVDNSGLDARGRQAGYTVFGQLESGYEVLDAVGSVTTQMQATPMGQFADIPVTPVVIQHIRRLE
jgi:cyclophilin family peptidyl-prolyl cis-trans isomerase